MEDISYFVSLLAVSVMDAVVVNGIIKMLWLMSFGCRCCCNMWEVAGGWLSLGLFQGILRKRDYGDYGNEDGAVTDPPQTHAKFIEQQHVCRS